MYLTLHKKLVAPEETDLKKVQLAMRVIQDGVKLKFGGRVSHLAVLQIMESMNLLLSNKKLLKMKDIDEETRDIIAQTLS